MKMTSQKKTHGKRLYMVYEEKFVIKLFPANVPLHIETSKLICIANQFIDSYLSLGNWGGRWEEESLALKRLIMKQDLSLTHFMPLISFDTPWCFQGVSKETSGMKWVNHIRIVNPSGDYERTFICKWLYQTHKYLLRKW